jgi:hypothetical protein
VRIFGDRGARAPSSCLIALQIACQSLFPAVPSPMAGVQTKNRPQQAA